MGLQVGREALGGSWRPYGALESTQRGAPCDSHSRTTCGRELKHASPWGRCEATRNDL